MIFNINEYKLYENNNILIRVKFVDTFNNLYESMGTGFVFDEDKKDYDTYIVCDVTDVSEGVKKLKIGDRIMTKAVYIVALRDIFEGADDIDKNDFILPERLVEGIINE